MPRRESSRFDEQEAESGSGPGLLGWGLLLGAGYMLVHQWPEIQRYLKMRSM